MNEFATVFGAVVPVFAVVGIGFVLRKLNWLTEEADQSLLRLTINLLYPALILDAVSRSPALRQWSNLTLAPAVGLATFGLGLFLAHALRKATGLKSERAQRTFAFGTGLYNYGFLPLPLALTLFDRETASVLFVHNVGVELGMWTFGLMLLTGHGPGGHWKKLVNAPLVAVVLALTLNLTGLAEHIPPVGIRTLDLLAQCAIPVSLLLIGATMADHLAGFHSWSGWRVITVALLLRLGLLPAAFLLLAAFLPASAELQRVIVLEAAMPSAVFTVVMAKHYGGDPPTALRVVVGTSMAALITIPFWIRFGIHFLAL